LRGEFFDLLNRLVAANLSGGTEMPLHRSDEEVHSDESWNELHEEQHMEFLPDGASDTSGTWSWITVGRGARCFLSTHLFQMGGSGQVPGEHLVKASLLTKHSCVLASDGTEVEVACKPETFEVEEVIKIQTSYASIEVTPDHRVPIDRGGQKFDVQAKDLQEGDSVLVDNEFAVITKAAPLHKKVEVVKLTFNPDKPVGVHPPVPAIGTKGHWKKPVRRSQGQNKKKRDRQQLAASSTEQPATSSCQAMSIPLTNDSFR